MAKTMEQLRADAERADFEYRRAREAEEQRLKELSDSVRPRYTPQPTRDEHGIPKSINQPKGEPRPGASARPHYEPPLRSPYLEPGAPPPDIDQKGVGTWEETTDIYFDLISALEHLEEGKLTSADSEQLLQQIVPGLLDQLAVVTPRLDCAFHDGPMSKAHWNALVSRYRTAFNPDKSLEKSIGTMRSRVAPKFVPFATEGAKWLFRRCPTGVPKPEKMAPPPVDKKSSKSAAANLE